jgi:ADP-ribosyl-[dinitrogen reductase] hydrolase
VITGFADAADAEHRLLGCLLAGAVGDALGANVEFDDLATIRRRFGPDGVTAATGYPGGHWPPGAVTDDTQMTLFTADGLLRALVRGREKGIVHPPTMLWHAYLRWLHTQGDGWAGIVARTPGVARRSWLVAEPRLHAARAPGTTVLAALRSGRMGTVEGPINDSKGCGGVMRAAPAGVVSPTPFQLGVDLAAITHGHPSGYLAAGFLAATVAGLLRGAGLPAAVDAATAELVARPGHQEVLAAVEAARRLAGAGWPFEPEALQGLGAGWVAEEALAIGLACALAAPDLRSGLLAAVNHGGDSDSTGSIAGNLLGAALGAGAVPTDLRAGLVEGDLVERMAADLAAGFLPGREAGWPEILDRYVA